MIRRIQCLIVLLISFTYSCDNEPYEGPLPSELDAILCEAAMDNLIIAQVNFENANATNYVNLCNDYKDAIEEFILRCPDEDHSELEVILDELGDCNLTSFFLVDFDGETFFADSAEAVIGGGQIIVKGMKDANGESVELILNEVELGTYPLGITASNGELNNGLYSPDTNNINAWQSVTDAIDPQGEITITEIDYFNLLISGTFSFTAYDSNGVSKEFTNGVFQDIPVTKEDDFFALVDGDEFVDVQIVKGINNFGWIGLLAKDANGGDITIAVNYNITPGTYDFTGEPLSARTLGYTPSFEDFHYGEGTITITTHNPETNLLMGTFECTALPFNGGVGTYEITEGKFCVTYLDGNFEED